MPPCCGAKRIGTLCDQSCDDSGQHIPSTRSAHTIIPRSVDINISFRTGDHRGRAF